MQKREGGREGRTGEGGRRGCGTDLVKEVGALDELWSQRMTGPVDPEVQSEGLREQEGREERREEAEEREGGGRR